MKSGSQLQPATVPHDIAARCLQLATEHVIVLVRVPKALKLGAQFRFELANRAERNTYDQCLRVWIPEAWPGATHRHYILQDYGDSEVHYLVGLLKALRDLNALGGAEIFVADRDDHVLRRVIAPRGV